MTNSPRRNESLWNALGFAWELGYTIALPLVLFALGGRWLDRRWGTSPRMLLIGIGIAFVITMIWLGMKMRELMKEFKK